MVMTFSSAAMTWSFDGFILLDISACSRNVLFAFTSFNPAAFQITNNRDVSYCITPPGRHVFLDFVPYQINSRAPDGCSFLWFGSEVDIVRVSISNMNQENDGSVPSPTSTASQVSETFSADGICYFTTTRGILRRPSNHCLLSLLERKSFIFNCNFMERLSITFQPSHPAPR